MDEYLRKLERRAAGDPSLIPQLATSYVRGQQLLISRECHLYTRGLFEGDIFGCLSALQLFAEVLNRVINKSSFGGDDQEDADKAQRWFEMYSQYLIAQDRKGFFNSVDFYLPGEHFIYPHLNMYGQVGRSDGWVDAESVEAWGNHFSWRKGRVQNWGSSAVRWEGNNDRDIDGTSLLEIYFDWPLRELPTCRIIYFNPTPEMQEALCSLNPRFFQHRALALKPPIQEVSISETATIPLHLRGTLIMPTCSQLRQIYYQRYPDSDASAWLYSIRDVWPVCIQCPGCNTIYSVYHESGEEAGAYCKICQFNLIDPYVDDDRHIRAFASQHATHWLHQSGITRPVYIPPDCPDDIRMAMLARLEASGEIETV